MHSLTEALLQFLKFGLHSLAHGRPFQFKATGAGHVTGVRETEKRKGFRLSLSSLFPRPLAYLPNSIKRVFSGCTVRAKLRQTLLKLFQGRAPYVTDSVEIFFRDGRSPQPPKMVVTDMEILTAKEIGTFTYDVRMVKKGGGPVEFFRGGDILIIEPL